MLKIVMIVMALAGLFSATTAQAEVVRAGMHYGGGAQLELPDADVSFVVPFGWGGQFDQATKYFKMMNGAGDIVQVRYRGKSFEDAIAEAKRPLATADGVKLMPTGDSEVFHEKYNGEVFYYSATIMMVMKANALVSVIKMPSGKALVLKSGGLNQPFPKLMQQLVGVAHTITFPAYEKKIRAEKAAKAAQAARVKARQQAKAAAEARKRIAAQDKKYRKFKSLSGNPDWRTHMNGRYYYYIKGRGNGIFDRRKIMLCADGTFWTSSASSGYSSGGGASVAYESQQPANEGHWYAYNTKAKDDDGTTKGILVMNFFNNSRREMSLRLNSDGGVYFDGTYYRLEGSASGCLD